MGTDNQAIEIAILFIEAVRVLAWPLLIAVILVSFNKPIREIVNNFSLKFHEANKVSIGSLSLEVEAIAREVGNPKLGYQVGSLTAQAVQQLLRTPQIGDMILISTSDYGGKREYGLPNQEILDALKELETKGFLKFRSPLESFLSELRRLPGSDTERHDSERVWYLSKYAEDSSADKKFREQGYSLTEKGQQAVDTIVKAVAAQLSRE